VRNTVARAKLVPLFTSSPVLLTGIATLVVWVPAQRASRVDPRIALRSPYSLALALSRWSRSAGTHRRSECRSSFLSCDVRREMQRSGVASSTAAKNFVSGRLAPSEEQISPPLEAGIRPQR
jgi:hypothetical protein